MQTFAGNPLYQAKTNRPKQQQQQQQQKTNKHKNGT